MPQSLSCLLNHIVISTKHREPWLTDSIRPRSFAYLAGIGRDLGCEVYRVGGMANHVHLAVRLSRTLAIADLLQKLKALSSGWIKKEGSNHAGFGWQGGYGAFSVGPSQLGRLVEYIDGQEEHHRVETFQEEYRRILAKYGVEYDERYVWD